MNGKIKYISLFFLVVFLQNSFSHSFKPYIFSMSLPTNIHTKLNEEVVLNLIINNLGIMGDKYVIRVYPNTMDIYVSFLSNNISLEPNMSTSVPIIFVIYSSLGEKTVNVVVCSNTLVNLYGEKKQKCNAQFCELQNGNTCIESTINFRVSFFSLGDLRKEFIILPLFLLLFVFLLNFVEYKRQKHSYVHHR